MFGSVIALTLIVNIALFAFGISNQIFTDILAILQNIVYGGTIVYVATNKEISLNTCGKIGAYTLTAYCAIHILIDIIGILPGTHRIHLFSPGCNLIIGSIIFVALTLYLFNLRTSLAIKISGTGSQLAGIISSAIGYVVRQKWDESADVLEMYDQLQPLKTIALVFMLLSGILIVAAFILSVIWLRKPTKTQPCRPES